jgi:tetratricopeptide (TPR) repeat protein
MIPAILSIALLALFAVVSIRGSRYWQARKSLTPPPISFASLDPSLRTIVETSRAAVVQAPKSAGAWGKLGEALHAAEFHAQARFCYSNAAFLDPNAFRWPYLLGLLELQEEPEKAIQHLARATELAGGKTDSPRFQLGRALVERGRYEEAAPHLQTLLTGNPNHAAARLELARVHFSRNALREATREIQPALSNSYTMRPALQLVAQMAQRNGQLETAASVARRAASLPRGFDWPDPVLRDVQSLRTDRARLAEQANALLQQQRLADADALLAKLLNAFPEDPEGLLLLGRLRYLERRCAEAEAVLKRHLAVQADSLNGLVQLGLALHCQQRWSDAIATLERVIQLKPDFAQAHVNLAAARARSGDSAGAIRSYRDALRCNPGDVNTHMALAEELANAGDLPGAAEHVQRAAILSPNDPRIRQAREQLQIK